MKKQELYLAPDCEEVVLSLQVNIAVSGLEAPSFDEGEDLFEL